VVEIAGIVSRFLLGDLILSKFDSLHDLVDFEWTILN